MCLNDMNARCYSAMDEKTSKTARCLLWWAAIYNLYGLA